MLFHIKHTTRYSYTGPVFCEPFTLRLRPRDDAAQRLARFRLSIEPYPAGMNEFLEPDGHVAAKAWFAHLTCGLAVTASSVVETLCDNPFNYLLEPDARHLGFDYGPFAETLAAYRRPRSADESIAELSRDIVQRAEGDTQQYLYVLCSWIHAAIDREIRLNGAANDAATTLRERRGACRDQAVLFIEACRQAGLAARFVSGHYAGDADTTEWHLHAWAEVYLPGAGWRGYDPSRGLVVADKHVALAAAADPQDAAPTAGSFRASGVRSKMEVQLVVRCEPQPGGAPSQSQDQSRRAPLPASTPHFSASRVG